MLSFSDVYLIEIGDDAATVDNDMEVTRNSLRRYFGVLHTTELIWKERELLADNLLLSFQFELFFRADVCAQFEEPHFLSIFFHSSSSWCFLPNRTEQKGRMLNEWKNEWEKKKKKKKKKGFKFTTDAIIISLWVV